MATVNKGGRPKKIDIKVEPKPKLDDLHYLLVGDDPDGLVKFAIEKKRRIDEWKKNRYRICLECGKKKLKIYFTGDSKHCKQCIAVRRRQGGSRRREYTKIYRKTDGIRNVCATQVVYLMKKAGLLIPQPCEICNEIKVQAHHDDYTKPWEVRWLCTNHHNEWHRSNEPKGAKYD